MHGPKRATVKKRIGGIILDRNLWPSEAMLLNGPKWFFRDLALNFQIECSREVVTTGTRHPAI